MPLLYITRDTWDYVQCNLSSPYMIKIKGDKTHS